MWTAMRARRHGAGGERGLTLIELVCCSAIILVLASVAVPVANTWVKRRKELELREALREIRTAIDRFQWDVEHNPGMRGTKMNATNEEGFPEKLEWLYEGYDIGDAAGTKVKYLRRLPRDPITGKAEWGVRSSRDKPGSLSTDGINIFDVHTRSEALALDGTPYAQW
jgi:general secretion pathway protein G